VTDEERTGSCVICQTRDPLPDLVPCCGPCRSRLAGQLRDIPHLVEELKSPPEAEPARDLVSVAFPAAAIAGQSNAPRVQGSREAPVPISVDRTDLLFAARSSTAATRELAYPEQDEDQVGYLSAATTLDAWCRDIAPDRRESVPEPTPAVQCQWLLDRLEDVFKHPAVDEMAKDVGDLWHALRRSAGLTMPKEELCPGVPCRSIECDLKTLVRLPGSEWVECRSCGNLLSEVEYQEWCRMVRAPLCGLKNGDWWCARTKRHPGPCAPAGLEEVVMRKIPTLFVRDFTEPSNGRYVTEEVTPGCEWVLAGEGVPTRKYDGTCVYYDGERWWARREVKPGKTQPPNFVPVDTDDATGKTVGWEPVEQSAFAKYHAEAVANAETGISGWPRGTYELVGPKVNGNPERTDVHRLWAHAAADVLRQPTLTFDGIRKAVRAAAEEDGMEGVVWHHPDGRMAKIKARDFPHD
jgi:hypothetical protein